tara:strand:+ start:3215 stop:5863 length:2649 start_codon:yes stop_codon:yes gene_type:complete
MDEFKGKYFIPNEKISTFTKYYYTHVFEKNLKCDLIERHENLSCLLFDLDFKLPLDYDGRAYDMSLIREFIRIVCSVVNRYAEIPYRKYDAYVFEKENVTVKNGHMKDGVHIVFPYIVTELATQYFFREELLMETKELLENDMSPIEDIIDQSIIEKNGWMMYGSHKPNCDPYKLTGIWIQYNDDNIGVMLPDRLLNSPHSTPSIDLLNLLSIRNFTMADVISFREDSIDIIDDFIEEFNQSRMKKNETPVKKYTQHTFKNIDLEIIRNLVDILDIERAENYQKWIEVGWCLHNIDVNLLDKWVEFSKKCEKYFDEAEDTCSRIWSQMNNNGLGLGTLHMWAKTDNKDAYFQILKCDEEYLIYQTIKDAMYSKKSSDLDLIYDVTCILKYKYSQTYICSSFDSKTWYEFNDIRWIEGDKDISLRKLVREDLHSVFVRVSKKYKDISKLVDENHPNKDKYFKTSQEIMKVAQKLRNPKFRDSIMKEATEHLYWDSTRSKNFSSTKFAEILDNSKNLVGLRNGTYDLDLGIFREARSEDHISLSTEIDYKPFTMDDDVILEIKNFMNQILPKQQVREYVLLTLASFLNGETSHEHFHVWVGSGGNGKSKLIELFENSFGTYCAKLSISALTQKRASSSAPTPDIVRLKGKRFVVLQEPNENDTLQVGAMKELTGGDKIVARGLNKEPIEFKPQLHMVLTCNYLPKLPADDGGTWRRIKVVEFTSSFKEDPNPDCPNEFPLDPHLSDKLNRWGIPFFWLLTQYYDTYKRQGYTEPEDVSCYTKQYQQSVDLYADFLNEKIVPEENSFLLVDDMYVEFRDWYSRTISPKVPSNKGIKNYMEKRYGKMVYKDHKKGWNGLILRNQLKTNLVFDDNICTMDIPSSISM